MYSVEGGYPMFFDVDGRGTDILPTGLWFFFPPPFLGLFARNEAFLRRTFDSVYKFFFFCCCKGNE